MRIKQKTIEKSMKIVKSIEDKSHEVELFHGSLRSLLAHVHADFHKRRVKLRRVQVPRTVLVKLHEEVFRGDAVGVQVGAQLRENSAAAGGLLLD